MNLRTVAEDLTPQVQQLTQAVKTLQLEKRHQLELDEASQELLEGLQDQINQVEAQQQHQCSVVEVDCKIEKAVKEPLVDVISPSQELRMLISKLQEVQDEHAAELIASKEFVHQRVSAIEDAVESVRTKLARSDEQYHTATQAHTNQVDELNDKLFAIDKELLKLKLALPPTVKAQIPAAFTAQHLTSVVDANRIETPEKGGLSVGLKLDGLATDLEAFHLQIAIDFDLVYVKSFVTVGCMLSLTNAFCNATDVNFARFFDQDQFQATFPGALDLYNFDGLVSAASKYTEFANTGDDDTDKRELAAFLAQTAHECDSFQAAEEYAKDTYTVWQYCDNTTIECASGKRYHGRGPIQLSWNYNYYYAGEALGLDLLANPETVATDNTVTWMTALWFWMTPHVGRVIHDVIADVDGFAASTDIINGGLECGPDAPNTANEQSRIDNFNKMCEALGVEPLGKTSCNA
ncbi:hypothetical protein BBJ29_003968 [Phytophthora kernoviae]|uniref:Glycoside hydrolase family 19 catalytic domain-containing protein n=1 Tax=Phytophthora kernoviae TaxID=325452 RepID=A0A3F2RLX3_9STRA|nr:hypothetical protein BBP00_00006678 [Phytophthora kernoviae]RLN71893.1 hypothetical protein BBJ29_003968 [Phytophthora kernoviae]